MLSWLKIALRRDIVLRALRVAAVVGTVLVAINQGDTLLRGEATGIVIAKVLLTYCVPYAVSTYASVETLRQR